MKTPSNTTSRHGRGTRAITRILLVLLAAGTVVSCHSRSKGIEDYGPVDAASVRWVKVEDHPPVYFPEGIAADHPTGDWHGMWVRTGDEVGTRYFIPMRGVNGEVLIEGAVAAMASEKGRQSGHRCEGGGSAETADALVAAWGSRKVLVLLANSMAD